MSLAQRAPKCAKKHQKKSFPPRNHALLARLHPFYLAAATDILDLNHHGPTFSLGSMPVFLPQLLQEMESLGTDQNRKVYARHGVSGGQYGLSFANLKKLQKRIKKDHPLALTLWDTANHDCRILATMVADPAQAGDPLLESWCRALDNYIIADSFAGFAGRTSLARTKAQQWRDDDAEWPGRAGWHMTANLAMKDQDLSDDYFTELLDVIESGIHFRPNRVRDAMNNALIAIGIRNPALETLALEAASRIGKVEVDHGQTNCKTPDAAAYIRRTVARRQAKAAGKK